MVERAEKAGFGVALVGHAALFALLSLRLLTPKLPEPPPQQAIEVSLAPDIALQQAAPPAPAPLAASEAPEQGPPEEEAVAAPAPLPKPAPAKPAPAKPAPAKPAPAKPAKPNPDRLASVVADAERADADRTAKAAARAAAHADWVEKVKAANAARADAARAAADRAAAATAAAAAAKADARAAWVEKVKAANAAKAEAARAAADRAEAARLAANAARAAAAQAAAARAEQARAATLAKAEAAKAARAKGSRLSNDFLKGLADTPAKIRPSTAAPGAVMNARALSDIASAIQRQIQPCANRQVNPGPGAEQILVTLNLKLNRDGSLAAPPSVVNHDGSTIDVNNRRYLDRVDDLAKAAFIGCAPLRGLPANLYDVPNGWRSINMRFRLPD